MPDFYGGRVGTGIAVSRDGRQFRFVPMNHPSMGHANKYPGEHETLARVLADGG